MRADIHKPFIITTDASDTHVSGVLSQLQADGSNLAIGYFSRKLKGVECRYSVTDKEALAVVLTCRHFNHFIRGSVFTIVTDHQPLTSIFKRKTKSSRMNRWVQEMKEVQYRTEYIKGKKNVVADSLFRPVLAVQPSAEEVWLGKSREEIRTLQQEEER